MKNQELFYPSLLLFLSANFILLNSDVKGILVPENNPAQKPNVIIVITDDQGYGDLACHGNPYLKTPNLDKLHSESIRFTNFHVCPTCAPTRAMLLTGMNPSKVGVWHTIGGLSLLDKKETTAADIFKANGYRTALFGKWHLGDSYPYRPQDRGFEEVITFGGAALGNTPDYWGNDYFDDTYFHNGKPEKFKGYCTDVWFAEVMKFIENNKDMPFFVYLSLNAPHTPYLVPDKYRKMYPLIESGLQEFYGMISNIDDNLKILRDKLKNLNLDKNTLFIFTTDNGSARGARVFNAGMRGQKGSEYDGGHRVPLFIYWPKGKLTGGIDIRDITAGHDILPSLVELCNLRIDNEVTFDGKSLVPLINDNTEDWEERTIVIDNQRILHPEKFRRTSVMTNQYRWVNGQELYDMYEDPEQSTDISKMHPEIIQKLESEYNRWWSDVYENSGENQPLYISKIPTAFNGHDIHGASVWLQDDVWAGRPVDGYWEVFVEEEGNYELSLRRWPKEFNKGITTAPRILPDLKYFQHHDRERNYAITHSNGKSITANYARLVIQGYDLNKTFPINTEESTPDFYTNENGDVTAVNFRLPLKKGTTRMSAWFINGADNGEAIGAYYIYVEQVN